MVQPADRPDSALDRLLMQPAVASVTDLVERWHDFAARLVPVIGDDAFRLLYARSLHLVSADHAWLALRQPKADAADPLRGLRQMLEGRDMAEAAGASRALLSAMVGILTRLIGAALLGSIMERTWSDAAEAADGSGPTPPQSSDTASR